jgi:hypothetical protein
VDDTLVDAITDGSADSPGDGDHDDSEEDGGRLLPAQDLQDNADHVEFRSHPAVTGHPCTGQHNGDVSPTAAETQGGLEDGGGKRKGTPFWRTNGKNFLNETDDPTAVDQDVGGSLLRPLLAANSSQSAANSDEASSPLLLLDSLPSPPPASIVVAAKRNRRDTGSSVQSDKSDLSGPTSEHAPGLKRARFEEATGGKAAGVRSWAASGKESGAISKKEKKEPHILKTNKAHDNG